MGAARSPLLDRAICAFIPTPTRCARRIRSRELTLAAGAHRLLTTFLVLLRKDFDDALVQP